MTYVNRGNRLCPLLFTFLIGFLGCKTSTDTDGLTEQKIDTALRGIILKDATQKEVAREVFRDVGNDAIPFLRKALDSEDSSDHLGPLMALPEVGTPEALGLLVECLAGDTKCEYWRSALWIAWFMEQNNWSSERMCAFPGLVPALQDRLQECQSDPSGSKARFMIDLAGRLSCPECLDDLVQYLENDSTGSNKKLAGRAIKAIQEEQRIRQAHVGEKPAE